MKKGRKRKETINSVPFVPLPFHPFLQTSGDSLRGSNSNIPEAKNADADYTTFKGSAGS
jgi:hypothetical protein